jgi:Family of unknown function (DUF6152)
MKRLTTILAIAAAYCARAHAHHSFAEYDRCSSVTIVGEIERISWVNPHVVFTIRADDAQSWLVQWVSANRLHQSGVAVHALNAGDRLVLTGSAHRDPDVHIVSLITAIRRASDGWAWSAAAAAEGCDG